MRRKVFLVFLMFFTTTHTVRTIFVIGIVLVGGVFLLIIKDMSFETKNITTSTTNTEVLSIDVENKSVVEIITSTTLDFSDIITTTINLVVPYISQMPDGIFVKPWSKACEEATIIMIEEFYLKNKISLLPITVGKQGMSMLFAWEDKNFGYNDDTDASSTARIINDYSSFNAIVKRNPTLEEIKNEIKNNRPVISLHYGPALNNPYLHFKVDGPQYHMIVLKGFDDKNKEFIAHDPGTYQYSGNDFRYGYQTIMSSLHDYDIKIKKAKEGVPVVLFTSPKIIIKTPGNTLYFIEDNKKYLINNPTTTFQQRRWSFRLIQTKTEDELRNFVDGNPIIHENGLLKTIEDL